MQVKSLEDVSPAGFVGPICPCEIQLNVAIVLRRRPDGKAGCIHLGQNAAMVEYAGNPRG